MSTVKKYNSVTGQWEDVASGGRGPKGLSSSLVAASYVKDNLQEWWIYPVATYIESESRTVFGGYATTGKILVNEVNHETGAEKRVEIADSLKIDDHNNPGVFVEAGRRILVAWTNHGYDSVLRFKVSDNAGVIESLIDAPEQTYTAERATTYTQIHKIEHLSDSDNDYFFIFFRGTGLRWYLLQASINQTTGALTFHSERQLTEAPAQSYLSTAPSYDNDNRIRISWYHNPASAYSAIRYLELDVVTGDIYSPLDGGTPIANISGSNLPLQVGDVTPLLPEPAEGVSRRMFYVRPGPATPGVAYAEWDINFPDEANYRVIYATNPSATEWATRTYGTAGRRIGYTEQANYIGGMTFPDPCYSDTVVLTRNLDDRSTLEVHATSDSSTSSSQVIYSSHESALARPVTPKFGGYIGAMVSEITSYESFAVYDSKVALLPRLNTILTSVGEPQSGIAFHAHRLTTQAITAATFTKVNHNAKLYDIGDNFSGGRFNVPVNGVYSFTASCFSSGAVRKISAIYVNGVEAKRLDITGANNNTFPAVNTDLLLSAGDYVEHYYWNDNGNDILSGVDRVFFCGHLVFAT